MTLALMLGDWYWVVLVFWILFGGWVAWGKAEGKTWVPIAGGIIALILFTILGWAVFHSPVH
jgi:hypothetical protein